ncbi:hypothetical protein QFC21_006330 [Naganishia friedmannii]|uniref:Uncharacterized protein n=1 Tax=Naganishia friedmannii TaxID=89922 RepID=A0ACC2V427_9TREE|nr:hypothetical protein QFC21_006330 [Naganishia friedmannii]
MSSSRKRPRSHSGRDNAASSRHDNQQEIRDSPLDACVQGYEATLTYDQGAFAKSLRTPEEHGGQLMRWIGSKETETDLDGNRRVEETGIKQDVWIDRSTRALSPASSTGWTDLPSDAEDTFFLSGDEGQEYEREKKRRRIDAAREKRVEALRARMAEEEVERREEKPADDVWGDINEEPPDAIKTLMRHTYKSLAASPNPQVLELRILTHHSGDTRFSFLKGRYKAAWEAIKSGKDFPKPASTSLPATTMAAAKVGIGGLMGDYGDSDSEADGSGEDEEEEAAFAPPVPESDAPPEIPDPPPHEDQEETTGDNALPSQEGSPLSAEQGADAVAAPTLKEDEEEKARAERREKARAWMAARKQATEGKTDEE